MKYAKILVLLTLLISVFSYSAFAGGLDVKVSPNLPTVNLGDTVQYTISVKNLLDHNIASIVFDSSDLRTGAESIAKQRIDAMSSLNAGETKTTTFSITVPANKATGTYSAFLSACEAANASNCVVAYYGMVVQEGNSASAPSTFDISMQPGDDQDFSLSIKNTGTGAFSITSVSSLTLTDSDDNEINIKPSFSSSAIAPGSNGTITLAVDVDSKFDKTKKSGEMTIVTDKAGTFKVTVNVNVKPLACILGKQGDLKITIDEPDTSDEFEVGQDIPVTVNVENNGNDDLDVYVEAILYDLDDGKKIDSYKSSKKNIDNDEDLDFEFKLTVSDTFDTNNDLGLYVKAYESKNEEEQCAEDDQSVDVTEAEDKVMIRSFTLAPSTAQCGTIVDAALSLRNVGSNDEDVSVTVQSTPLGVYQTSPSVSLGTDSNDKDRIASVSFKVPSNAKEGTYTVTATATYASQKISSEQTLQVYCPQQTTSPTTVSQTGNYQQPTTATTYTQKGLTDYLDINETVPMSVWILVDVVLVLGVIVLLILIFRRR